MSDAPTSTVLPTAELPAGHRCRIDDPAYESVGSWYRAHTGHVPVQAAWGLQRYMQAHGCTFAEAFAALTGPRGPIVLLERPDQDG